MEICSNQPLVASVSSNVQASINSKNADISKQVSNVLNAVRSFSSANFSSLPGQTISSNEVIKQRQASPLYAQAFPKDFN